MPISSGVHGLLFLQSLSRSKDSEDLQVRSPEEAMRIVAEISRLTEKVRRTPGLEEGKVEEIERGIDRILREYSDMNPRRPTRFLRDLADMATMIQSAHEKGMLSERHRKLLEVTMKKTRMRDFYVARKLLNKFGKPIEVKKERDAKLDRYRSYYRKLENQAKDLKSEIQRLRGVPSAEKSPEEVDGVKKAVDEYNEAASSTLMDFLAHAPCLESLSLALEAASIPELNFPAPKSRDAVKELMRALSEEHVRKVFGNETLSKLVSAASFSDKRLEHFVRDFKWFQRQLHDNVGWLSELTAQRSDVLRIQWPEPVEALRGKIGALYGFLKRLPRSERAVQALTDLKRLTEEGHYDVAIRSAAIYKTHGEAAVSKFRGTLAEEIGERESELRGMQELLANLPGPDRLIAESAT